MTKFYAFKYKLKYNYILQVFIDLGERYLIRPESVKRGKLLGRGAFGFVFRATVKQRVS